MARKELSLSGTETVIGSGVKLKGTLNSDGDISIDGELKGAIRSNGNLTIGPNASIEGNVSALNVHVAGLLEGNIKSENETSIEGSGKVKGDIHTALLSIQHGAIFSGQTVMRDLPTSKTEPEVDDEQ